MITSAWFERDVGRRKKEIDHVVIVWICLSDKISSPNYAFLQADVLPECTEVTTPSVITPGFLSRRPAGTNVIFCAFKYPNSHGISFVVW